ncbi:MAG TPA: GNAT family N-acetyltransferase [Marmoricola sp.]
MSRSALMVREASPGDAAALLQLWTAADLPVDTGPAGQREAAAALARGAADPDERLLVGEVDGRVVAALHLQRGILGPLSTESTVHTSHLLVLPEFRRHGFARTLLEHAVSWAEENGIAHVSAVVDAGSRECNRFLARLGLGTYATMRLAPTAALRLSLGRRATRRPTASSRQLGAVVAHRRSLRRRQAAGA